MPILDEIYNAITKELTSGTFECVQVNDAKGIKVIGFTGSPDSLNFRVGSSGAGEFITSSTMLFQTQAAGKYIFFLATADIYFNLGDAVGARHFYVRNSSYSPVVDIDSYGRIKIKEVSAAGSDTAGYGQLWIKNTTPNELWFTDDTGVDHQVAFV